MSGGSQGKKHGRIWDPLVRLFHWSLVAAFATAWWGKGEAWIHEGAGKIVLVLIIYRVVWGLIGPGSARFENFLRGPLATLKYVGSILRGKPEHFAGHNPAGAAMIGLMLLTLAVTTVSGILMSTTALWGNAAIELVHGTAAYAMLFLIAGHLLGVLAAAIQHRENLVKSMITGRKWVAPEVPTYLGGMKLRTKPLLLSLAFVGLAASAWQGGTTVLNASAWRMHKTISAELKKLECADAAVQSPRIELYPAAAMHYDIASPSISSVATFSLNAEQALAKRPDTDFAGLAQWCNDLNTFIAMKSPRPGEPVTASFAAQPIAEVVQLPEVSPAPEIANTPVIVLSSVTAMMSRLVNRTLPVEVPEAKVAALEIDQRIEKKQRPAAAPKKVAAKKAKVAVKKPKAKSQPKIKNANRKKNWFFASGKSSGDTKDSRPVWSRGNSGGGGGNSGSGSSNSGQGSSNSGSGSSNSGQSSSNSGSGSGNSGHGGGDDDD